VNVIEARAAPPLRYDDAERTELAQRAQLRARKMVLAIPLGSVRRELRLREGTHGVANLLLFFGQEHELR